MKAPALPCSYHHCRKSTHGNNYWYMYNEKLFYYCLSMHQLAHYCNWLITFWHTWQLSNLKMTFSTVCITTCIGTVLQPLAVVNLGYYKLVVTSLHSNTHVEHRMYIIQFVHLAIININVVSRFPCRVCMVIAHFFLAWESIKLTAIVPKIASLQYS